MYRERINKILFRITFEEHSFVLFCYVLADWQLTNVRGATYSCVWDTVIFLWKLDSELVVTVLTTSGELTATISPSKESSRKKKMMKILITASHSECLTKGVSIDAQSVLL